MTRGEYRVGIDFNPGGSVGVSTIKATMAALIDEVLENGIDPRTSATAATALEEAAMWAVKALTKSNTESEAIK